MPGREARAAQGPLRPQMVAERRALRLVLAGLALIAIASGASWFFSNFERATRQVPMGAAPEARRNPLLALERLLARMGIEVQSVPGRALVWSPPAPTDTLVVRGLGPLGPERRATLRAWVESGGTLVTEAVDLWDPDEPPPDLLGDLGIRLVQAEEPEDRGGRVLARVDLPGVGDRLGARFEPGWHLTSESPAELEVRAAGRLRLVRLWLGKGSVTALSDTELLTNARIGELDHGLLAAHLVRPAQGGKVWLLFDSGVPWLGAILWHAAPLALIGAGATLIVWLWSLGPRLGPLEAPPDRRRRDLIEHLDASAAFLWRHGLSPRLVEPARRRVLAELERHRPELRRLAPAAQAKAIAETLGRPVEPLTRALVGRAEGPADLVESAAALQALWRSARRGHRDGRRRTQPPTLQE